MLPVFHSRYPTAAVRKSQTKKDALQHDIAATPCAYWGEREQDGCKSCNRRGDDWYRGSPSRASRLGVPWYQTASRRVLRAGTLGVTLHTPRCEMVRGTPPNYSSSILLTGGRSTRIILPFCSEKTLTISLGRLSWLINPIGAVSNS